MSEKAKKVVLEGQCSFIIESGEGKDGNKWYGIRYVFDKGYRINKYTFLYPNQVKQIRDGAEDFDL